MLDVTSTFIWLATLLSIAIIKRKSNTDIHYYRYYLPNLYFKILFSFLFSFFYIIAYSAGGDTWAYFKGATALNNLLLESPNLYFEELISGSSEFNYSRIYNSTTGFPPTWIYFEESSFFISKIISLVSIFTLKSYFATSIIFAFLFSQASWKIKKIISWADQVVVGNSYLKDYALQFNPNVKIIPTTIDTINVHNKCTNHDSKKIIIGWTGSHTTMGYLPYLLPVLKELEKKFNFKFRVISNHPPPIDLDSLEFVKWNKKTEIKDLAEINIGVMPLEDTIWAQGKCGFKGLQYMALQIPSVMSNVGVNIQIIDDGHNGFICKSKEDWYRVLSSLMSDVKLRTEIGQKGKKTVEHKYSVKANKQKYISLFK